MIKVKVNKKVKLNKKSPDVHQEILGLGVLIENVNNNVQLIAEQYGDIKADIFSIKKTQNSHTDMIGKLSEDVSVIKQTLKSQGEEIKSQGKELKSQGEEIKSQGKELKSQGEEIKSQGKELKSHGETLNFHTGMIGKLAIDFTIVKEDIAFIKGGLKKKIDTDEFTALERRVVLLEKCH